MIRRFHNAALGMCLVAVASMSTTVAAQDSRATSGRPLPGLVAPEKMPGALAEVRFDQNLGAELPLDARFVDETGNPVLLGDFFGKRPVVVLFVYFECPMLCTLVFNGLAKSLGVVDFNVGTEFDVVAISIDPEETPAMAAAAEERLLARYGRAETAPGWHFLTGTEGEIQRVADTAGFAFAFEEETGEFAHAAGLVFATEDGTVNQYLLGIEPSPKDIRLALVAASERKLGSLVDHVLLYCYRYDPALGKYTLAAMRILRGGAILFLACLLTFLWVSIRRDRRMARLLAESSTESRQVPTAGAA